MHCTQLSWRVNDKRLHRLWSVCHRQLLLFPVKRNTLLQEPLALFMCLIFWLPNRFKYIYCLSSTNRVFIWIMFCILNWKRCVCNRLVFSTFRLSTVIFFVSTNCFCGRYKIRVVYSYVLSQKNLTSKTMPIKARIFWNNIAYMFR